MTNMLVHIKQIISWANKNKKAVGAFNTFNLESTQAIIQAAEKTKKPVIIQFTETTTNYAQIEALTCLIKKIAQQSKAQIALHLDHGKSLKIVKQAIDLGFSSIMMDGSMYSYKKNVNLVKKIVNYAKKRKTWVQAELGRIADYHQYMAAKNKNKFLTDPKLAASFINATKANILAVCIGNVHGVAKIKKGAPKLDLKRLEQINKEVSMPIVLHGASAIPVSKLKKCIDLGVRIFNVDSELRHAFTEALKKYDKKQTDPRKILRPVFDNVEKAVIKKIKVLSG